MTCPKCQHGKIEEKCDVCHWSPDHDDPSHHVPPGGEPFDLGGQE